MGYGMRMWSVPEGYVYHGKLNGKTAEFLVPYNQHFMGNFPKLEELILFLIIEDIWEGVEQTEDPN